MIAPNFVHVHPLHVPTAMVKILRKAIEQILRKVPKYMLVCWNALRVAEPRERSPFDTPATLLTYNAGLR